MWCPSPSVSNIPTCLRLRGQSSDSLSQSEGVSSPSSQKAGSSSSSGLSKSSNSSTSSSRSAGYKRSVSFHEPSIRQLVDIPPSTRSGTSTDNDTHKSDNLPTTTPRNYGGIGPLCYDKAAPWVDSTGVLSDAPTTARTLGPHLTTSCGGDTHDVSAFGSAGTCSCTGTSRGDKTSYGQSVRRRLPHREDGPRHKKSRRPHGVGSECATAGAGTLPFPLPSPYEITDGPYDSNRSSRASPTTPSLVDSLPTGTSFAVVEARRSTHVDGSGRQSSAFASLSSLKGLLPRIRAFSSSESNIFEDVGLHIKAVMLFIVSYQAVLLAVPDVFCATTIHPEGDQAHRQQSPRDFLESHYHSYTTINVPVRQFMINGLWFGVVTVALLIGFYLFLRLRLLGSALRHSPWSSLSFTRRVYGLVCFAFLFYANTGIIFGGIDAKVPLAPDIATTALLIGQWLWTPNDCGFLSVVWRVCLLLTLLAVDLYGLVVHVRLTRRYLKLRDSLIVLVPLTLLTFICGLFMTEIPGCTGNDVHWVDFSSPNMGLGGKGLNMAVPSPGPIASLMSLRWLTDRFHPFRVDTTGNSVHVSKYIEMEDGTDIAVDVYLPVELAERVLSEGGEVAKESAKYPTFLEITRYNRRMTLVWPFTMMPMWNQRLGAAVNMWNWQLVEAMVPNGYVVVVADTRGSGASTGRRPIDFAPEEVADMPQVVQWVKQQFWSSGQVAMGGISYDGMTGLQAAALGGVDVAIALFTPMDVTSDLIQPGGLVCSSFVEDYAGLTQAFEKSGNPYRHLSKSSQYPVHVVLGFLSAFGGPSPVESHEHKLPHALDQHSGNWNMSQLVQSVRYKDDSVELPTGVNMPIGVLGVTDQVMAGLAANDVDLYIVGGYCDSSSARGSARLFNYMTTNAPNTKPKLILGPWTHSGRRNCSPYGGSYSCFEKEMYYDLVRYLDCRLGRSCWGDLDKELTDHPVHYFETGAEVWRGDTNFPPKELEYLDLQFSSSRAHYSPKHAEQHEQLMGLGEGEGGERTSVQAVGLGQGQAVPVAHPVVPDVVAAHDKHRGDIYTAANEYSDWLTQRLARWLRSKEKGDGLDAAGSVGREDTPPLPHSYSLHAAPHRGSNNADDLFGYHNRSSAEPGRRSCEAESNGDVMEMEEGETITYPVDYTTTSGALSRWLLGQHPFRVKTDYSNRYEEGLKGLSFTSDPLAAEAAMVGSCVVEFAVHLEGSYDTPQLDESGGGPYLRDISVFAYVEDVDVSTGHVTYVTEGRALLSHRARRHHGAEVGSPEAVEQPGTSEFHRYSTGPDAEQVMLTTEPVAYRFAKGHALRLTLTGADVHNFRWESTSDKVYDDDNDVPSAPIPTYTKSTTTPTATTPTATPIPSLLPSQLPKQDHRPLQHRHHHHHHHTPHHHHHHHHHHGASSLADHLLHPQVMKRRRRSLSKTTVAHTKVFVKATLEYSHYHLSNRMGLKPTTTTADSSNQVQPSLITTPTGATAKSVGPAVTTTKPLRNRHRCSRSGTCSAPLSPTVFPTLPFCEVTQNRPDCAHTAGAHRPHLGHTTNGVNITRPSRWKIVLGQESRIRIPIRKTMMMMTG